MVLNGFFECSTGYPANHLELDGLLYRSPFYRPLMVAGVARMVLPINLVGGVFDV
jgi:hypothetical protein